MKKILVLVLSLALVTSFAACGKKVTNSDDSGKTADYKLGMGITVTLDSSADKTADKNANAEAEATVATAIFDKDGKVVSVAIDCAQTTVEVKDGKILDLDNVDLRTKYEKKGDYGMVAYNASPIGKEWFEQVDTFEAWCVGKTVTEITAAAGTDTDLKAGCTIGTSDFVESLKKASEDAQAVSFTAAEGFKLGLNVSTDVSGSTDMSDKGDATAQLYSTFGAAVVDADGKILAAIVDEIQPKVQVDKNGAISNKDYIDTKRNLKDEYGMKTYSPIGKEWYEQEAAFAKYVVGKTASEVLSISTKTNDSGSTVAADADLAAGCTMGITNYIKVVSKAATIAD